ncbi:MAG: N-formylglutamate amidohydrolase [Pirellulales bacterium]|nr:N-formylglutamate amidohydrolase [Pirellulales bacterium]
MAAAIHDGHYIREELLSNLAISEADRLREEDPFTGGWTSIAPTSLVARQSRFEVDFNRPREKAVYQTPEDAWGLKVWKSPISRDCIDRSLAVYDAFYQEVRGLLARMTQRYERIVVLDLHTYNHRREGAESAAADPYNNPEVNIGTGTMDRQRWAPIVNRFILDLRNFDYLGHHLDVRENVKFRGGYFPLWIHQNFPETVCVLSVEFKKFFMDEWTGRADDTHLSTIQRALQSTIWGLHEELVKFGQIDRELTT